MNWIKENFRIISFLLAFAFALGYNSLSLQGKIGQVEAQIIAKKEIYDHAMGIKEGIKIQTLVESMDRRMGSLFEATNASERRIMQKIEGLEKKIAELSN